jgi:hypothetical protein
MTGNLSGGSENCGRQSHFHRFAQTIGAPAERTVNYGLTEDRKLAGSGVTRGACSSATTHKSEFARQTLAEGGESDDGSPETGGDFLGARRD